MTGARVGSPRDGRLSRARRRAVTIIGSACAVLVLQLVQPATAHADVAYNVGNFRVKGTGLCMDDYAWSTARGTPVKLWNCWGAAVQQWKWEQVTRQGVSPAWPVRLRNVHSNMCLVTKWGRTTADTDLVQWPCAAVADREAYNAVWIGNDNPQGHFRLFGTSQCIGARGGYVNGSQLILVPCSTAPEWEFVHL